ncbi:dephospho-CoA kinase [Deltaproteobacteria bacterium TL4]
MLTHNKTPLHLIGLTGGIGSGKSSVAEYIKKQGIPVIYADQLGHRVLEAGHEGYFDVLRQFGKGILNADQTINRAKLGEIVFNDTERLKQLNAISHPLIGKMLQHEASEQALLRQDGLVFIEAALLIEANWKQACQQIWVVMAHPEMVIARLKQRNGFTMDQIRARLKTQLTHEERLHHADVVIENNTTLDALYWQIDHALDDLINNIQ